MVDAEKVKAGLRICSDTKKFALGCNECPYLNEVLCVSSLASDAAELIALLEERIAIMQESMEALEKRCNALEALEQRCKTLDAYETARLMTWEEVLKIAEHNYNAKWDEMESVWLEGHESLIFGFAEPQKMGSYIELFTAGDECGYDCEESEYMKKYRCWTNRPTKEQRAVKWE